MKRDTTRESGAVLIAALFFSVVILAFVSSLIYSGVAVSGQKRTFVAAEQSQQVAESGVQYVLGKLSGDNALALIDARTVSLDMRGSGERAVGFDATIEPAAFDGIDNDADGAFDEPDEEDMYEVVSTGFADDVRRTVRVTLQARFTTPMVPSAMYIHDPMANVAFHGNAFRVSGNDVGLDGAPTGAMVPGLGVAGDPSYVEDSIAPNFAHNIVGLGGTPSIAEVPPVDLGQLVLNAAPAANVTLPAGFAVTPPAPGAWGTLDRPVIAYGAGSVHISGNASGAGVLVVDGDLTISGDFFWDGMIVVRGEVRLTGGGNTRRVTGGMILERGIVEDPNVVVTGTVDILYSRETLRRVGTAFANYVVLNWREGPTP